ncbi:pirin family protein [Candidatus Thorarchaeota archaeon]|nr:MAG: pirin family protein [Candidatus Thorarchaeota archaeon]
MTIRRVFRVQQSREMKEGAGVTVRRAMGHIDTDVMDPFLLLDDFGSDNPDEFKAGFPWHPHRGIETVTYMLEGKVAHEDSTGGSGVIRPGEVQWMTAGSGIIHQEMPDPKEDSIRGLQLWVNLPSSKKMTDPKYRGLSRDDMPEVELDDGIRIKIIAGEVGGMKGPVEGIAVDPEYLDVKMPANSDFNHPVDEEHTVLAYVVEGEAVFGSNQDRVSKGNLVVLTDGDQVRVQTGPEEARFILVSGKPLNESIAWRGPIVMNTQEEIRTAFMEYRQGTFVKTST